jgi:RNA polymerase sigma-70 factor, ECF subfamily
VTGTLAPSVPAVSTRPASLTSSAPAGDAAWLEAFHRGDRAVLARCYEDHVRTVAWAVRPMVDGLDRETVVHDVFCRLFGSAQARRSFTGGNFGAWLITVARRQAIDFCRQNRREKPTDDTRLGELAGAAAVEPEDDGIELRVLVARFRERCLPPKWEPVFRARFLEQLDQREAARRLGMARTTLAYQELRIRALLRRFVLEEER